MKMTNTKNEGAPNIWVWDVTLQAVTDFIYLGAHITRLANDNKVNEILGMSDNQHKIEDQRAMCNSDINSIIWLWTLTKTLEKKDGDNGKTLFSKATSNPTHSSPKWQNKLDSMGHTWKL